MICQPFYIFLFVFAIFGGPNIIGEYYSHHGKGASSINLKKDSTYVQQNADCTYAIETTGKWRVKADTLLLETKKVFCLHPNRKKTLITDTTEGKYNLSLSMTKYLIKTDSLILLHQKDNKYYKWWTLTKQKS